MTNQKLRVGQIGVGGFGAYRRARMRETGLFDLTAAYDLNPDVLAQAKDEDEDGARLCASYDELISTPGLEAIVISTRGKFHCEQMLAAMKKGLHIFVEKPLCATPEELSTLLAGQRETGVIVGVGHTELPLQSGQIDKSETVQFNQGRNHDVRSQTIHGGVQT